MIAAISDLTRNGFLKRPATKKDFEEGIRGLFHGLPDELQITSVMCAMEMAPETRETNNYEMERQRDAKREKEELIKELSLERASDLYIECIIYHQLWLSDRC